MDKKQLGELEKEATKELPSGERIPNHKGESKPLLEIFLQAEEGERESGLHKEE
ncbi:hypothetical protein Csa_010828 [Cucumis sativus]|uniref:Uncharacterized protein n=1 Tax=Cucumis sativus TaxID=3659 RepID=A0A0A0L842_CUCSA|nr:hypothetical protein Csa_010828 [Cucumis sativus]